MRKRKGAARLHAVLIIFPIDTDMWNSKKEQCTVPKNIHNHPDSQGASKSKTFKTVCS